MANVTPPLQSSAAGEISPRIYGRTDLAKYSVSYRTLQNMIPQVTGSGIRRPGTRFINEVKDSSKFTRLLPFEFSTIQAHGIEIGDLYARFYANQARVEAADVGAAITNGDFTANITGWTNLSGGGSSISHDAANGRLSLNSNGTTNAHAEQSVTTTTTGEIHVIRFQVFGAPGDSINVRVGTSSGGQEILEDRIAKVGYHCIEFTPGASPFFVGFLHDVGKTLQIDDVEILDNVPVEIGSPYSQLDVELIKYTQSRDVLFLAHPDFHTRELSRFGFRSWSLTEFDFRDGPWLTENTDDTKTLEPSALTGLGVTLTAAGHTPFKATDVGRLVRLSLNSGTDFGWAVVVGFTSSTVVTIDIRKDFVGALGTTTRWRLGLYSDTTGWPAADTFHEERFVTAGADIQPDRIDMTRIGDFSTYTPGTEPDDAIAITIASDQVNAVLWLASGRLLFAGTPGGEARIGSDSLNVALSPTNVQAKFETRMRSANVQPLNAVRAVLFLQRHSRKLRELVFDFQIDGFKAQDLTILADHISGKSGFVEMAYQQEPWSTVWLVRADGQLVAMTYEPDENAFGWAPQPLGGDGKVESVISIPGTGRDEPWLIVNRTINGATKRYIEMIEAPLDDEDAQANAFYVDSGLSYNGPPVTSISGLDHLEGETVRIMVDGAAHPDRVVSGGSITLNAPASIVHVGLGYRWIMQPNRPDAGSPQGTAIGKQKRVAELTIQAHRTLGISIGRSLDDLVEIPLRSTEDAMDTAIPLFSGELTQMFPGTFDAAGDVFLSHDGAFPATITMIVPHMEVHDG